MLVGVLDVTVQGLPLIDTLATVDAFPKADPSTVTFPPVTDGCDTLMILGGGYEKVMPPANSELRGEAFTLTA
jgi:hypothetical protein